MRSSEASIAILAASMVGGCAGALPATRLTAVAASSGPHPSVAVTLLDPAEADAPDVPRRWIHLYAASEQGLAHLGSLRADEVVGVAGSASAPVASFRAHGSDDEREPIEGLVADDLCAPRPSAAGQLASLASSYAALDATRLSVVRPNATPIWTEKLPAFAAMCDTEALALDLFASPSGRFICAARTERTGANCADAVAHVAVFSAAGASIAHADVSYGRAASGAQCAVADDGSAIALLPSVGADFTTAVVAVSADGAAPLCSVRGAVIDAAANANGWAALSFIGQDAGASLELIGRRGGTRALRLGGGRHALVGLASSVLVVSSTDPLDDALRVRRFEPSGRVALDERCSLAD